MVAIEQTGAMPAAVSFNPRKRTLGLMAGAGLAVLIAWVSFLAEGGDMNAARFASTMVLNAASLAFVVYYVAGPLSRLVRSRATETFGQARFALAYGFVGMMGVYLATVVMPDYLASARVPLATLTYAVFTVMVAAVFLLSAGSKRTAKSVTLRSLQSLSSGYFWFAFMFTDLDRMVGPHRPDGGIYGWLLLLLVIAIMVRFADAFMQRFHAPERMA
jgi:hypothetical protein